MQRETKVHKRLGALGNKVKNASLKMVFSLINYLGSKYDSSCIQSIATCK